jgi:tetratricopeptide (TPR) repeat protein
MPKHERRGHNNLAFVLAASLVWLFAAPEIASAQFTTDTPTQAELLKLPEAEQSTRLAEVVRRTQQNRKCARARVSLEKLDKGAGGWLVQCEEGQDYWVMPPIEAKKAATAIPCIIARATIQFDCYANFRTTQPDSVQQCMKSPFPDRMISACTAIIQSGRLNGKPDLQASIYQNRAGAFLQYGQFDLALADVDRAVALNRDANALYGRAIIFERKGDFNSAITDLNETLRLQPDHPYANYERGFVRLKQKDYDRAIEDLNQAVRLKPDNAKAYRDRGQAYRAKGEPAKADADQQKASELDPSIGRPAPQAALPAQAPPPQNTPAPAKSELSETDKQAAYCMEASFGYARQHTGLVSLLRENLKAVEALREKPGLSPADRAQIDAKLKSTNDNIAANDATGKRWNGHVLVFMDYLKRRGLLQGAGPSLIAQVSQEVSKDQQAVAETYSSCLRLCKPDSAACKNACNDKAESSEPRKRMQRCEQIVTSFK